MHLPPGQSQLFQSIWRVLLCMAGRVSADDLYHHGFSSCIYARKRCLAGQRRPRVARDYRFGGNVDAVP